MKSLCFVLAVAFAGTAMAQQPVIVERYTSPSPVPRMTSTYTSGNATAQGVAEMMASRGSCQHFGNPTGGYEGVGMSSSPEGALGNCCYSRSGMRVVDQGVARGRNGRWYACKRYR
jgi:hypothetical protein